MGLIYIIRYSLFIYSLYKLTKNETPEAVETPETAETPSPGPQVGDKMQCSIEEEDLDESGAVTLDGLEKVVAKLTEFRKLRRV